MTLFFLFSEYYSLNFSMTPQLLPEGKHFLSVTFTSLFIFFVYYFFFASFVTGTWWFMSFLFQRRFLFFRWCRPRVKQQLVTTINCNYSNPVTVKTTHLRVKIFEGIRVLRKKIEMILGHKAVDIKENRMLLTQHRIVCTFLLLPSVNV